MSEGLGAYDLGPFVFTMLRLRLLPRSTIAIAAHVHRPHYLALATSQRNAELSHYRERFLSPAVDNAMRIHSRHHNDAEHCKPYPWLFSQRGARPTRYECAV